MSDAATQEPRPAIRAKIIWRGGGKIEDPKTADPQRQVDFYAAGIMALLESMGDTDPGIVAHIATRMLSGRVQQGLQSLTQIALLSIGQQGAALAGMMPPAAKISTPPPPPDSEITPAGLVVPIGSRAE